MEPIHGFILFSVMAVPPVLMARARGRFAWIFFPAQIAAAFAVIFMYNRLNLPVEHMAYVPFLIPLVALYIAFQMDSDEEIRRKNGSYRGMRKCPSCAELVMAEAMKCKHCGSDLPALSKNS